MRARLVALVVVCLLLAPLPALAAPERAESQSSSWTMEGWLSRVTGSIAKLFGATEGDLGANIAPDEFAPPPAPAPPSEEGEGDLGPDVDPNG